MKRFNIRWTLITVIAGLTLPGTTVSGYAAEVFSTNFSAVDSIEKAGWKVQGDWSLVNYGDTRPTLQNNPGPVAKFAANGKKAGMLTRTFDTVKNPANLKLTFDAGYGWGAANHSQGLQIMLLDAEGNGYVFDTHRAKAKWGVQWGTVSQYGYNNLTWNSQDIDTSQKAIVDGGGLRTYTITREKDGKWSFSGDGWTGATPATFTDNTTTEFSQVVLYGIPNTDDLLYGKVKLDTGATALPIKIVPGASTAPSANTAPAVVKAPVVKAPPAGTAPGTASPAFGAEVFSTDFSTAGSIEKAGWKVQGDWSLVNYGDTRPTLQNNPGPVAKFAANGKKAGMLTRTFDTVKNPANLKLTFDAGYGWGAANHSQGLQIMLLDAEGNGYVFDTHRAKAKWGVQWGTVSQYGYNNLTWNSQDIDTSQKAIVDGGGLRTYTITREKDGKWSFSGDGWTGATPATFTDNTTTEFSQVVLYGIPNTDDLLYGKVKLELGGTSAAKPVSAAVPPTAKPPTAKPSVEVAGTPARSGEYADFNPGRMTIGSEWKKVIVIKSPELRSEVKGAVNVQFSAPGMTRAVALCWQQPTADAPAPWGHDAKVADITLDAEGNGAFIFPADKFPNGPITLRVLANNDDVRDLREIQLWNSGGVVWNQGIPKTAPPAANGMKLVFSDDFDGPLSISHDGQNAKYASHKPGGGDFSGYIFSDFEGPDNPFSQKGNFLRIHATKKEGATKGSSGLLSALKLDGTGALIKPPFYMECRFTAQSAPGTWPAFWTISQSNGKLSSVNSGLPADELDIVEAYGGVGEGNPNHPGYSVTSHFWQQKDAEGKNLKSPTKRIDMLGLGNKSYWSTTFHTYGLRVDETDTMYYLDGIEVFRHPTSPMSKTEAQFFMINYAIGGISGWKIDLAREGNASDMWVDYVRVYSGSN